MVWVWCGWSEQLRCMGALGAQHSLPQSPLWALDWVDEGNLSVSLRDSREWASSGGGACAIVLNTWLVLRQVLLKSRPQKLIFVNSTILWTTKIQCFLASYGESIALPCQHWIQGAIWNHGLQQVMPEQSCEDLRGLRYPSQASEDQSGVSSWLIWGLSPVYYMSCHKQKKTFIILRKMGRNHPHNRDSFVLESCD